MLIVKCNNCDNHIRCAQGLAGERVQCPRCGAHLRVPFDAPDLDAIKQRAEAKPDQSAASKQPIDDGATAVQEEPPDVIQASVHDLYTQQQQQHQTMTSCLEVLHEDLEQIGTRLHTISVQNRIVIVLAIVALLCVLVLTIGVWVR